MGKIDITVAGGDYDRIELLLNNKLSVEGINLNYVPLEPDEIFWRMLQYREFDASEMSLAAYTILVSRGVDDFVAIPVFTSRMFRHSSIYIRDDGDISRPSDLAGGRIGQPEYQMTMSVWVRGILNSEYGLNLKDITWYLGGVDKPGRRERLELKYVPPNIMRIEDRALSDLLLDREIDALCSAHMPARFKEGKGMKRLFDNYRTEEIGYYQKTGVVPIMHLVVIKKSVLENYPWVATSLYKAYDLAFREALNKLYNTDALPVSLIWLPDYIEQEKQLFRGDMQKVWSNGLARNFETIEMFIKYCRDQDLLERSVSVEELFVDSLRTDYSF